MAEGLHYSTNDIDNALIFHLFDSPSYFTLLHVQYLSNNNLTLMDTLEEYNIAVSVIIAIIVLLLYC